MKRTGPDKSGFTLVEVIVAATIISLVMVTVYYTFSNTIRIWRTAESGMYATQESRTALSMMGRELRNIAAIYRTYNYDTSRPEDHWIRPAPVIGSESSLQYCTIVPSMDLMLGDGPRWMWVRYFVEDERLFRQESPARHPETLAWCGPFESNVASARVPVLNNVEEFWVRYLWYPRPMVRHVIEGSGQWRPEPLPLDAFDMRDFCRPPLERNDMPVYALEGNQTPGGLPQAIELGVLVRRSDEPGDVFEMSTLIAPRRRTDWWDPQCN